MGGHPAGSQPINDSRNFLAQKDICKKCLMLRRRLATRERYGLKGHTYGYATNCTRLYLKALRADEQALVVKTGPTKTA